MVPISAFRFHPSASGFLISAFYFLLSALYDAVLRPTDAPTHRPTDAPSTDAPPTDAPSTAHRPLAIRPPSSDGSPSSVISHQSSVLRCLDLDEGTPLPEALKVGKKTYDEFKRTPLPS